MKSMRLKIVTGLLLALLSITTQAAITPVSSTCKQNNGSTDTTVTTVAIDTSTANFIAVTLTSSGGAGNFTSITDSKANSAPQVALNWTANGGGDSIRIMYYEVPTVGSGHTFTGNFTSLTFAVLCVSAYSGMATSATLDKTASGTGTSTTLLTSATATTTQADELLIGTGTISDGANTTFTAGASYNMRAQQGDASIGTVGFIEDRIVSSTGAYTSGATWGGASGAWVAGIATFKGTGGGGGGGTAVPVFLQHYRDMKRR